MVRGAVEFSQFTSDASEFKKGLTPFLLVARALEQRKTFLRVTLRAFQIPALGDQRPESQQRTSRSSLWIFPKTAKESK